MAIKLAEYQASLTWDASKFTKGMTDADSKFTSLTQKMGKLAGGAVVGITGAITAAAGSMVAFGKNSVDAGMSFDAAVSQIAATMGKTTDEIANLRQVAQELGASTSFSATQAAEGLNILAMSGLSADEQIAAIPDVLNLAAAGSIEMADAASYAVGAIKGFGDEFSNTQYYTDLMAKGATLAATDVKGLGEALSGSSATAAAYGQQADDVTVALLRLAEQNVTGSAAATAMSRAMADLFTPTTEAQKALNALGVSAYDSKGNAREFNEVVDELNSKLSTMTDEEANAYKSTIFTAQGLSAFNKMTVSSTEKVQEFRDGLASASDGIGSAAQQAETMLDNLQGDITIFGSAVEGLQIGVSDNINGLLRDTVQFGTEQIGLLTDAVKENGLVGLAGAAGEILSNVVVKIAEYLPDIVDMAIELVNSLVVGLMENADRISDVVVGVCSQLIQGVTQILPNLLKLAVNLIQSILAAVSAELPKLLPIVVMCITDLATTLVQNLPAILEAVLTLIQSVATAILDSLPILIAALPEIISGIVDFIVNAIPQIIETVVQLLTEILNYLPTMIDSIVAALVELIPVLIEGVISLVNGIVEALPDIIMAIINALPGIIDSIINAVIELLPVLIQGAINLVLGIVNALPQIIQALIDAVPTIIDTVINALLTLIPNLIQCAVQLVQGIVNALPQILTALIDSADDIITSVVDALITCIPQLVEGAVLLVAAIVENLPTIILALIEAVPSIIDSLVDAFSSIWDKFTTVGENLVKGLWEGIQGLAGWLWDNVSNWASGLWDGICGFFGIHSPSRKMMWMGQMLVDGLANSINDYGDTAVDAAVGMADNVLTAFNDMSDGVNAIDRNFNSGVKLSTEFENPDFSKLSANLGYNQVVMFDTSMIDRALQSGNYGNATTSNKVINIKMGDISVSGVLDKTAAEQVEAIAENQVQEFSDALAYVWNTH